MFPVEDELKADAAKDANGLEMASSSAGLADKMGIFVSGHHIASRANQPGPCHHDS